MTPIIDEAAAAVADAIAELNRTWREHALMLAVDRDAARRRADALAQLLTPAAHIVTAYLDRVHQPDLRDEAHALLARIRAL